MVISQTNEVKLDKLRAEKIKRMEVEFGCRIVALEQANQLAKLTPEQYGRVQAVESELGVSLIAYETDTRYRLAKLSSKEVAGIKELEKRSGHVLVAYEMLFNERWRSSLPQFEQVVLTDVQSDRLQALEEESGLVLVACKK